MKKKKFSIEVHFPKFTEKCVWRNALLSLMVAMLLLPNSASAQGKFILGVECNSGNFWSVAFLGLPTRIINGAILALQGRDINNMGAVPGSSITYRYNRIKVNGQNVEYDGHKTFGFKALDLFRDFEYSLKFGWQPAQIPVGFYARVGFRHENFETRISGDENWTKHRINYLRPGIGIRISPLENMIDNYDWCPVLEIGSTYDYHLSYKGAYGKDKDQLNNGVSMCIGLGAKFESGTALMLTFDRQNYDLFNKDFTVNNTKPYADTKSNHFNVSLSLSLGL